MTDVFGKEVLIKRTPYEIFSVFSNLSYFVMNLPEDMKNKVTADADSIVANVKGMNVGIRIEERIPYSLIVMKDEGKSPFPFKVKFHLSPVGLDSTLFQIEVNAELNTMMKMMLGGKLQSAVDKMTEQIEKAVSGEMPDMSKMNIKDFS